MLTIQFEYCQINLNNLFSISSNWSKVGLEN